MTHTSLSHLSDEALVRRLREALARDRATSVEILRLIAEVDARRLYAADHDSMFAWCLAELRLSEDVAAKRLHVARAARQFPERLERIADGRLTLSAAGLLAPHLDRTNARELIDAATHLTNDQVRHLLAGRFPRSDVPTVLRPVVASMPAFALASLTAAAAPERCTAAPATTGPEAGEPVTGSAGAGPAQHAVRHVGPPESPNAGLPVEPLAAPAPQAPVRFALTPLAPDRDEFRGTLDRETRELLLEAQALLGHALPSGDLVLVLKRALRELVTRLGRRRGALARDRAARAPRAPKPLVASERHIPDRLKNAVWQRDQGRCTHVGPGGRRCEARTRLEFDHVVPIARGGRTTLGNLRLRCQTHNRLEVERVFGARHIHGRIQQARESRATPTPPASAPSDQQAPAASRAQPDRSAETTRRPQLAPADRQASGAAGVRPGGVERPAGAMEWRSSPNA